MTDEELDITLRDWIVPAINDSAGFDSHWRKAFVALRVADVVCQVATGDRLKHQAPDDRAWFKAQAEQLVEDAVLRIELMILEARGKITDLDERYP